MHDRFSLETLLAPVDDGAGSDPRDDPAFLDIKDARGEARLAERGALKGRDPDGPGAGERDEDDTFADPLRAGLRAWEQVAEGAAGMMANGARDLQLAAWLTEAWLRTDSFAGLAAGFALMSGLIDGFWDAGLHPQEDEDGPESRVAPLFGLFGRGETGTLLQPIKLLPLTDHGAEAVALWTIENAHAQSTRHDDPDVRDGLAARRQERISGMEMAIVKASPEFAAATRDAVTSALAELDLLMAAVDMRTSFGRFGTQVARPLEDVLRLLRAPQGVAPGVAAIPDAAAPAGPGEPTRPPALRPAEQGAMTRETALATLLDVAAFFDRNEPQSLVGSGLRDIVRRADLSVDELLRELLPEAEQRTLFLMRAGIRVLPPVDDGSTY